MQTVRTMIAARRRKAGARGSRRAGLRLRAVRLRVQHHRPAGRRRSRRSDRLPPASSDHDHRKPTRRSRFSSAPAAANSTPRNAREVLAFAQTWKREATGGVIVDLPVGTSNERAAAAAARGIRSILVVDRRAAGRPRGARLSSAGAALATIRITYPKIAAQAGPCGLWPADIGPSWDRDHFENQPRMERGLRVPAQPRRHGRQSGRSGAAARRDAGVRDAAHDGDGEIPVRRRHGHAGSRQAPLQRSAIWESDVIFS